MKELNVKSNNKSQIKDKILVLGKKRAFELERQVFILAGGSDKMKSEESCQSHSRSQGSVFKAGLRLRLLGTRNLPSFWITSHFFF